MTVHILAHVAWHDSGWNGRDAIQKRTTKQR